MIKRGLVLGKFMPLHKGHELLLRFAQNYADELWVVVDRLNEEAFSGAQRCGWVQKTIPGARVFYLDKVNPQAPEEHPDFWNIWKESLLAQLPGRPDYVFASESYGFKLAEVLGAEFIPVDLKRETVPISATRIRESAWEHWDYLSDAAKPDLLKRVCIFGPESTGKTTLANALARHFDTVCVPEYARLLIEAKGDLAQADMLTIAKGQVACEAAVMQRARRILFCDTDPLATTIWSRWLFGECDARITELAELTTYDAYLLTDIDLPWEQDAVRYFPERRQEFLEDCVSTLERYQRPYALITGSGDVRLSAALHVLEQRLGVKK